jgi:hypothetical protein
MSDIVMPVMRAKRAIAARSAQNQRTAGAQCAETRLQESYGGVSIQMLKEIEAGN